MNCVAKQGPHSSRQVQIPNTRGTPELTAVPMITLTPRSHSSVCHKATHILSPLPTVSSIGIRVTLGGNKWSVECPTIMIWALQRWPEELTAGFDPLNPCEVTARGCLDGEASRLCGSPEALSDLFHQPTSGLARYRLHHGPMAKPATPSVPRVLGGDCLLPGTSLRSRRNYHPQPASLPAFLNYYRRSGTTFQKF